MGGVGGQGAVMRPPRQQQMGNYRDMSEHTMKRVTYESSTGRWWEIGSVNIFRPMNVQAFTAA